MLHKIYGEVLITPEVLLEFKLAVPDWIKVESPLRNEHQKILENSLDKGESSAIALALEKPNSLLLIDEQKGRKIADKLGIPITGSLGVLLAAKEMGFINSVSTVLQKIKHTDFRISSALETAVLHAAKEL